MNLKAVSIIIILLVRLNSVSAQHAKLAADQNPRYMESQLRYQKAADTLIQSHGITLQETYRAYDWFEARLERRRLRSERRDHAIFNRRYLRYNFSPGYYYPYYRPYRFFRNGPAHRHPFGYPLPY